MRFTGQFTGAKLDLSSYKKKMNAYLEAKLHEAANSWLQAVTGRVPVWSGMARGSLLELSELVSGKLAITPKVKSRIPLGQSLGTAIQDDFIIIITTAVPHYTLQEYTNVGVSKSAPWRSLNAGATACKEVIKNVRLPKPKIKSWLMN